MSQADPHQHEPTPEVGGGDPDTPGTVVVGIVGAILLFVAIVGVQALFYNAEQDLANQINRGDPRQLSRLRAEQLEAINSYGWQDQEQGIVTIPIDRAMELVAQELGDGDQQQPDQQPGEQP